MLDSQLLHGQNVGMVANPVRGVIPTLTVSKQAHHARTFPDHDGAPFRIYFPRLQLYVRAQWCQPLEERAAADDAQGRMDVFGRMTETLRGICPEADPARGPRQGGTPALLSG